MKASTPTSGSGKGADRGKVLLFVFEHGESWPTLCVKTTRTYAEGEVIKRHHGNLISLVEGARNSRFAEMFARPLYLYDDGEFIFSIESACRGRMLSGQVSNLDLVIKEYNAWQSHLASSANQELKIDSKTRLPSLIQHGDLTPDNVLICGKKVYLIDYDYVGFSLLAGFDLFNLLLKTKRRSGSLRYRCQRYFPNYFQSIGVKIKPEEYDNIFFEYYLEELRRKGRAITAGMDKELVNFKTLMNEL